jgi:hypothetical protein
VAGTLLCTEQNGSGEWGRSCLVSGGAPNVCSTWSENSDYSCTGVSAGGPNVVESCDGDRTCAARSCVPVYVEIPYLDLACLVQTTPHVELNPPSVAWCIL